MMGAGLAGSTRKGDGANVNQIQFGNKLQGLPPTTGQSTNSLRAINNRAFGNQRNVVFCVNQLGGVGGIRGSNMFASTADGVGNCVPGPYEPNPGPGPVPEPGLGDTYKPGPEPPLEPEPEPETEADLYEVINDNDSIYIKTSSTATAWIQFSFLAETPEGELYTSDDFTELNSDNSLTFMQYVGYSFITAQSIYGVSFNQVSFLAPPGALLINPKDPNYSLTVITDDGSLETINYDNIIFPNSTLGDPDSPYNYIRLVDGDYDQTMLGEISDEGYTLFNSLNSVADLPPLCGESVQDPPYKYIRLVDGDYDQTMLGKISDEGYTLFNSLNSVADLPPLCDEPESEPEPE